MVRLSDEKSRKNVSVVSLFAQLSLFTIQMGNCGTEKGNKRKMRKAVVLVVSRSVKAILDFWSFQTNPLSKFWYKYQLWANSLRDIVTTFVKTGKDLGKEVFTEKAFLLFTCDRGRSRTMFTWKTRVKTWLYTCPEKRTVFVEKKQFLDVHSWSRTITDDVHLKEKSVRVALYLPCKRNVLVEKSSFWCSLVIAGDHAWCSLKEKTDKVSFDLPCKFNVFGEKSLSWCSLMIARDHAWCSLKWN